MGLTKLQLKPCSFVGTTAKADTKGNLTAQEVVMSVYSLEARGKSIRFAAGEFSNGVWGFFVPT
jgi:hypothetical protein